MVTVILLGREASALRLGSMDGDRSRADVAQSRWWLGTVTNRRCHPCNLDLLYLEELEFIQVCIRCHLLSEPPLTTRSQPDTCSLPRSSPDSKSFFIVVIFTLSISSWFHSFTYLFN